MRKLTKLIKESIDLSMRMSWLNRIEKSLNKRHKIYQAYKREVFVTNELVKRYNELYPDAKLKWEGE